MRRDEHVTATARCRASSHYLHNNILYLLLFLLVVRHRRSSDYHAHVAGSVLALQTLTWMILHEHVHSYSHDCSM